MMLKLISRRLNLVLETAEGKVAYINENPMKTIFSICRNPALSFNSQQMGLLNQEI
jgi:hypothetical protein